MVVEPRSRLRTQWSQPYISQTDNHRSLVFVSRPSATHIVGASCLYATRLAAQGKERPW